MFEVATPIYGPHLPAQPLANRRATLNAETSLPRDLIARFKDRRRDLNADCGYPETTRYAAKDFQDLFDREPIVNRVIQLYPKECWQVQPSLVEDDDEDVTTPFEAAWDDLGRSLRDGSAFEDPDANPLWEYLQRADVLSGIGQFGVILLGFGDATNGDLTKPLKLEDLDVAPDPVEGDSLDEQGQPGLFDDVDGKTDDPDSSGEDPAFASPDDGEKDAPENSFSKNVFCPTGVGGGVDPSCEAESFGGSGGTEKEIKSTARKLASDAIKNPARAVYSGFFEAATDSVNGRSTYSKRMSVSDPKPSKDSRDYDIHVQGWEYRRKIAGQYNRLLEDAVKSMKDETASAYARDGVTHVTVYRGLESGQSLDRNSVAFFSYDKKFAQAFAGPTGRVVEMTVPVERVVYDSSKTSTVKKIYDKMKKDIGGEFARIASEVLLHPGDHDAKDVGPGRPRPEWLNESVVKSVKNSMIGLVINAGLVKLDDQDETDDPAFAREEPPVEDDGEFGGAALEEEDGFPSLDDEGEIDPETGEPVQKPLPKFKPKVELKFIRVYAESLVQVSTYESDPSSPRFNYPLIYQITMNDPRQAMPGQGASNQTLYVHWTRVIHLADTWLGPTNSEIFALPRAQVPLNRAMDVQKVSGAAGEGYWKMAFAYAVATAQKETGGVLSQEQVDMGRAMFEQWEHGTQRYGIFGGVDVNLLSGTVNDPTPYYNMSVEQICVYLGCPVRVFKGSERGELASSQDDAAWNDRLRNRQRTYVNPKVIAPFVDRLIAAGCLPRPKSYRVVWPDLDSSSKADKATIASTMTQALGAYVGGGVENLIPPMEYLTEILGMDSDKARAIVEAGAAHAEEMMAEQQTMMEEHGFVPDPSDPTGEAMIDPAQQETENEIELAKAENPAGVQSSNPFEKGGGIDFPPKKGKPPFGSKF